MDGVTVVIPTLNEAEGVVRVRAMVRRRGCAKLLSPLGLSAAFDVAQGEGALLHLGLPCGLPRWSFCLFWPLWQRRLRRLRLST